MPGEGKEVGPSLGANRQFLEGIFLAPQVVSSAVKTSILTSALLEELGYLVDPKPLEERVDIVLTILFGNPDDLISYCAGIQAGSPIDSFVKPIPIETPGYDDKVIMAVGLYIERKGILEFLELARRMPEYKFIWFGYTKPSLIPVKISDAIKNKTDNVYFPGYVKSEELKDAYAGCDLYIFPTKEETEGIVLLEALAMKTKTLISDIPIYDDWLKDGVNVYKAKNVDDFEKKIKLIVEGKLPDLTLEGYKVAKERDIKKIGYKLKKVYEYVLEKDLINK